MSGIYRKGRPKSKGVFRQTKVKRLLKNLFMLLARLILLLVASTFVLFFIMGEGGVIASEGNAAVAYVRWLRVFFLPGGAGAQHMSRNLWAATVMTLSISAVSVLMLAGLTWALSWLTVFSKKSRLVSLVSHCVYGASCFPAISLSIIALVGFMALFGKEPFLANFGHFSLGLKILALGLPIAILSLADGKGGNGLRYLSEEMRRIGTEPFVIALKARGVKVGPHIRRNVFSSAASFTASSAVSIVGWTFIVEYLFNIEGLGLLLVKEFNVGNYETILAVTAVSALIILAVDFMGRAAVAAVDPRLRDGVWS